MHSSIATILPPSYFDGLSNLWGACAYVASAIISASLAVQVVRTRFDPISIVWLLWKVALIGLSTLFLREWLMRLNDVVISFGAFLGTDPRLVDEKFIEFISGKVAAEPNASVWDVIWGTKSIGTAICYAFLWLFGWASWSVQYIVKLVGGILLTAGWSLSPIFLGFFMIRSLAAVAHKYIMGLIAIVSWPFGWTLAAVVTNAMLEAAASANLVPVFVVSAPVAAPALTVLLIGTWMMVSSLVAPWVTTKVLLSGSNPATAFASSVGSVMTAAFTGGISAAVAAVTGGAAAGGVVGAAVVGAGSAGAESALKGGSDARVTSTAIGGMSMFNTGSFMRRHVVAAEQTAAAHGQHARATEAFADQFAAHARRSRAQNSHFGTQPHQPDPNQAAIDIDTHDKT